MRGSLWTYFDAVSHAVPERPAITWRDRSWTYEELRQAARRWSSTFTSLDLGLRGEPSGARWECNHDRIGLMLRNHPTYLAATLGGFGARVATFNVNYRYVAGEVAALLIEADADALVHDIEFADDVHEAIGQASATLGHEILAIPVDSRQLDLDPPHVSDGIAAAEPVDGHRPDDPYLLFTGGTTGTPKGVLWRHDDIFTASIGPKIEATDETSPVFASAIRATPAGVVLPIAPFMHGAAQWTALRALNSGGQVVINDRLDRVEPGDVWALVQAHRVDTTLFVGEAFARPLIDELECGDYDASSLRVVVVGGAVTSSATKERLLRLLPKTMIADSAGASETGAALASVSTAGAVSDAAIFVPNDHTTVLDETRTVPLEPGSDEIGWLAKCGPIPLAYLDRPERTAETFPIIDGTRWSIPGDRARRRADGMVELLGRDSMTINTAGEKVFVEEVETALMSAPGVHDVIVVGVDDEIWGQAVTAVVVADPDVGDDVVLAAAGERLARYKLPKTLVRVPQVKRSAAGKADYRWARDQALAARSAGHAKG